jgi:hypothetical protein
MQRFDVRADNRVPDLAPQHPLRFLHQVAHAAEALVERQRDGSGSDAEPMGNAQIGNPLFDVCAAMRGLLQCIDENRAADVDPQLLQRLDITIVAAFMPILRGTRSWLPLPRLRTNAWRTCVLASGSCKPAIETPRWRRYTNARCTPSALPASMRAWTCCTRSCANMPRLLKLHHLKNAEGSVASTPFGAR